MGSYRAGIGLLITLVGYLILFGVVSLTQFIAYDSAQTTGIDFTNLTATNIGGNVFTGSCERPRYIINPQTGESNELTWNRDSAKCDQTIGSLGESFCSDIEGCTWENETKFLWFFESSAYCDGYINLTNYTDFVNQTEGSLPATIPVGQVHVRGPNIYYDDGDGNLVNDFCSVFDTKQSCELFGCTYIDPRTQVQNFEDLSSASKIWNTVKDVFTFQIDLGLDGESDYWVSIVFWLLSIIVIIQVYFLLPFLH